MYASVAELAGSYEAAVEAFYAYLPDDIRGIFVNDAIYHKRRYLDMLRQDLTGVVVELGSDKPFISQALRSAFPSCHFHTISMDMPISPLPVTQVDIESQSLPFEDASVDRVIFTEVLEHLFRDPSKAVGEINRVLRAGGLLFLTTPNACGYDVLQNILAQKNPNERNQFYARMELGHPHLWTAKECALILEAHGFAVRSLTTMDYYDIPKRPAVIEFIARQSSKPELHGQTLKIVAVKTRNDAGPHYPPEIYPDGVPVQLLGALQVLVDRKG